MRRSQDVWNGRRALEALRMGSMCLLALLSARQGKPYEQEVEFDGVRMRIASNGHQTVTISECPAASHDG
jgi:hypothetical protein